MIPEPMPDHMVAVVNPERRAVSEETISASRESTVFGTSPMRPLATRGWMERRANWFRKMKEISGA